MNRYVHFFSRICPSNGVLICYELGIRTSAVIMVEDIKAACDGGPVYHEALADELHARFCGRQVMRANHHGVWIETLRGFS